MVKFKFYLETPRGGHFNTHYAKNNKHVKDTVDLWNRQFKGTGYRVHLVKITATDEALPDGYTCW